MVGLVTARAMLVHLRRTPRPSFVEFLGALVLLLVTAAIFWASTVVVSAPPPA